MAGYQRMVSYLYEYNQGEKGDNVGYAKLEIREDIAKMIVSIRLRRDVTETCQVSFYYREGRQAFQIPAGEIRLSVGRVQERLLLPGAKAGESGLPVTQMNGIIILLPDSLIGSAWDEQGVPTETEQWSKGELQAAELLPEESMSEELSEKEAFLKKRSPEEENQAEEGMSETAWTENAFPETSQRKQSSDDDTFHSDTSGQRTSKQRTSDRMISNREVSAHGVSAQENSNQETFSQEYFKDETSKDEIFDNKTSDNKTSDNETFYDKVSRGKAPLRPEQVNMTEVPITEPRGGNNYRSESWMEETQREGEAAQIRRQEKAEKCAGQKGQEEASGYAGQDTVSKTGGMQGQQGIFQNRQEGQGGETGEAVEAIKWRTERENGEIQSQQVVFQNHPGRQEWQKEAGKDESTAPENSIDYFFQQSTRMCPFEDDAITNCVRIEPADLEYFPKETWILGSNSFLLHGYYTYGHLILAKMRGMGRENTIIGVPGLYQNRERFLARLFGFEYFKPISKTGAGEGEFGYWYLLLPDMEG